MSHKCRLVIAVVLGVGGLTAQDRALLAVFTAAQAEAGRRAFQEKGGTSGNKDAACAFCHTTALTGRTGAAGELPPLSSLDPALQKTIQNSGRIPPLAGPKFTAAWDSRTTRDLINRIKLAAGQDEPEETSANLAAYILQMNGAKPGTKALTTETSDEIRAVLPRP